MVLQTNDTILEQNSEKSEQNPQCLDSVLAEIKKKQEEVRMMQEKQTFLLEDLNARLRELEEKMQCLGKKQEKLDSAKKLLKSEMSNEKYDELQFTIDRKLLEMLESWGINWGDRSKRSEIVDRLHEWSIKLGYMNFAEYLFVLDPELKKRIPPIQEENRKSTKPSKSENHEPEKNELKKNELKKNEPGIEERKEKSCNTSSVSQQSAYESVSYVNEDVPEKAATINDKIPESKVTASEEDIAGPTVSVEVKAEPPEVKKSGAECPLGTGCMSSAQEKLLEAEGSKLKNTAKTREVKKLKKEYKETKSEKESTVEAHRRIELESMLKLRKSTATDKCSKFRASNFFKKIIKQSDEATLDLVEALKLEEESSALRGKIANRIIFFSADEGYSKIADFLLNKLPELRDFSLNDGNTPLHIAALQNHVQTVNILIKWGVDVDAKNFLLSNALGVSVIRGNVRLVEILLKAGADINAQDLMSKSPLHFAADGNDYGYPKARRLKCLHLLLEAGANKDVKDVDGSTPLIMAVFTDNMEAVGMLLRAGADVNAQNDLEQSALHFAVRDGQKKIFRMLLQAKANLELQDHEGCTALHVAVIRERPDFITELLKAGANHLARDRRGRVPAQWTNNSRIKALLHMKM